MPRQKNTRPTNIYWLYDTRPEMVAKYGPEGLPFYCGKTVYSIKHRFQAHWYAVRMHPDRPVSVYLSSFGECTRAKLIETVPVGVDWVARERYWIARLRTLNPDCVNIAIGGNGSAGFVHSAEFRAKASAVHRGKITSEETKAKMRATALGRKNSPGHIAKTSAALRGKRLSPEHLVKRAAGWERYRAKRLTASYALYPPD
jgi:hypothetical protein